MKKSMKRIAIFMFVMMMGLLLNTGTAEAKAPRITKKNPMVVMRVSWATAKFNESWGGVFTAVEQKDTDVYTLYDVVIWNDRISLYKFHGNINEEWNKYYENYLKRNNYPRLSNAKFEKLYRKFREKYRVKQVKCKNKQSDITLNSGKRLEAYKSFIKIIHEKSPSPNFMIKYSGHGGHAMFCHSLTLADSKKLMEYSKNLLGRKFSIIDYGTNCQSGTSSVLSFYQDYTEYMIVSQPDYGGFGYDNWTIEVYNRVNPDPTYPKMFRAGDTVAAAAKRLGKQHIYEWPAARKNLKKKNLPQAVTVVKMKEYKSFMAALKAAKGSAYSWADLKEQASQYGGAPLLKKYNKAVIYYKNDAKYISGPWTYGSGITWDGEVYL